MVGTLLMLMLACGLAWSGREGSDVFAAGAALGLALLSKGNAYLFAPPLLVWIAARAWSRRRWRALPPLVAMVCVALALNAGHWARNL